MSSVLATLVAVATAAALLRVGVGRLTAAEQLLQARGRTEAISDVRAELEALHTTLCDARERPASDDGA